MRASCKAGAWLLAVGLLAAAAAPAEPLLHSERLTSGPAADLRCRKAEDDDAGTRGVLDAATQLQKDLEEQFQGARLVLLAHAGQDLSRHGVRFAHLGIAYRTSDPAGAPAWRVVHQANPCGTGRSALYRQGLPDFLQLAAAEHGMTVIVPTPELQARLLDLLKDERRLVQLHAPAYSALAYAWGTKYQQSTQWVLEMLAYALDPQADSRERAQAWLRARNYQAGTLTLGLRARMRERNAANIAFDDHPLENRLDGRIETVTVDSVLAWLLHQGMVEPSSDWARQHQTELALARRPLPAADLWSGRRAVDFAGIYDEVPAHGKYLLAGLGMLGIRRVGEVQWQVDFMAHPGVSRTWQRVPPELLGSIFTSDAPLGEIECMAPLPVSPWPLFCKVPRGTHLDFAGDRSSSVESKSGFIFAYATIAGVIPSDFRARD